MLHSCRKLNCPNCIQIRKLIYWHRLSLRGDSERVSGKHDLDVVAREDVKNGLILEVRNDEKNCHRIPSNFYVKPSLEGLKR